MNYEGLIKALRCKRDDCEGCDIAFFDKDEGWMCQYAAKDDDAAAAIEELQQIAGHYEQTAKDYWKEACEYKAQLPKRGKRILTNDEIETIRIHMNAIKEQLCNQYRHREAEVYQTIVDKLAKMMEVQE